MTEEGTSKGSGLRHRIASVPRLVWLVLLAILVYATVRFSQWLMLILLVAIGLWPITLLLGLIVLALSSIWMGGWSWIKGWFSTRLRGLVVPVLSVFTALVIGALILMFTDQQVYQLVGEGQILEAIRVAFSNLATAYKALYEGAFGNPGDITGRRKFSRVVHHCLFALRRGDFIDHVGGGHD